jgi:hypothetical protein
MRRSYQTAVDDQSLQADVMRFMAIIAFCLIAILAIVRNVDTPAPVVPPQAPPANPVVQPASAKTYPEAVPQRQPVAPPVAVKNVPAPLAEAEPVTPPVVQAPQRGPLPEPPQADPVLEGAQPEQSLSLRFASDQDFLRLLGKGAVTLYLFNQEDAWVLGKDYAFAPGHAPRQLYEVLPQTVPAVIAGAAAATGTRSDHYRWGVQLPPRTRRQIDGFLKESASGQLLIDRYGGVRHVAKP